MRWSQNGLIPFLITSQNMTKHNLFYHRAVLSYSNIVLWSSRWKIHRYVAAPLERKALSWQVRSTPSPPPFLNICSSAVEQEYNDDIATGFFFISRWLPPSPPPSCPTSTASPSQRTTPSSSSTQSSLIPRQGGGGNRCFHHQKNPLNSESVGEGNVSAIQSPYL